MLTDLCLRVAYYLIYFVCMYCGAECSAVFCEGGFMLCAIHVPIVTLIFVIISHKLEIFSRKNVIVRYGFENVLGSLVSCFLLNITVPKFLQTTEVNGLIYMEYLLGLAFFQAINFVVWFVLIIKNQNKIYPQDE